MRQNDDFIIIGGYFPDKKYINLLSQGETSSLENTTGFLLIQSLMLNPEVSL